MDNIFHTGKYERLFGLIGYPLGHSFSQGFFNRKFEAENINARYVNFEIPSFEQLPGVVAGHPTEEELATYGMDEPQYALTVTHPDWEEPLVLKTSRVNGVTYLMKNREPVIFSMGSAGVLWHGWQLEDMMSNMVLMPRLGDLKTVRVTLEGTTYEFAVETAISEEKGTEGQMMPTRITLDGQELDLGNFKVFYQLMLNCIVNSRSDGAETEMF